MKPAVVKPAVKIKLKNSNYLVQHVTSPNSGQVMSE